MIQHFALSNNVYSFDSLTYPHIYLSTKENPFYDAVRGLMKELNSLAFFTTRENSLSSSWGVRLSFNFTRIMDNILMSRQVVGS
jgi:hypothetical protein